MNPAEAVQAHLDLGAPESIGMHFGTFQLTTEGIDEPLHALDAARQVHDIQPRASGRSASANPRACTHRHSSDDKSPGVHSADG